MKKFTELESEKRNPLIDFVKGVGIFLMLWGHCIQYDMSGSGLNFYQNSLFKFIYGFHMPLLMLVSGYLFSFSLKKYGARMVICRKWDSLLRPIVFGSFLSFLFSDLLRRAFSGLWSGIHFEPWLYSYNMWFLWAVLVSSSCVAVGCSVTKHISIQVPFMTILMLVVILFPNGEQLCFVYPYFIIGFMLAQVQKKTIDKISKFMWISLIIYPIFLAFFEEKHYIYTTGILCPGFSDLERFSINMFRWTTGLVGCISALYILRILYRHLMKFEIGKKFAHAVETAGQSTLQIYLLSVPLLSVFLSQVVKELTLYAGRNFLVQNMAVYNFVITPLMAVLYMIMLYKIQKTISRFWVGTLIFGR